ncbi:MAG: hypothetical protein U0T74_11440 [Chitinophagales bacterium]
MMIQKVIFPSRLLAFLLVFLFCMNAMAGAPQGINYQAVVRNSSGNIVPNQAVNVRLTIHSDSINGPMVYRESDSVITTPQGIFTVVIGGGGIVSGSFSNIKWGQKTHYLQVEADITGGFNFTDMGTSQLVSVPYAMYAETAGSVALAENTFHPVTGNDSIVVGTTSNVVVPSTVTPSSAVMKLSPGNFLGQILYLQGLASASNGVRFENSANINIGNSGSPVDLTNGAVLVLMWNGTQWLRVSYSQNN